MTAAKSYLDTSAALDLLGIDAASAARCLSALRCTRSLSSGRSNPQACAQSRRVATKCSVVEEKAAFLEPQVAQALFNVASGSRPRLVGKRDELDQPVLPADVLLDAADIAIVIAQRLAALGVRDTEIESRAAQIDRRRNAELARAASPVSRPPYFCSGCPHNTSTLVPEGSLAMSGIGCHTMALAMDRNTLPPTQMGGEGMTWAGVAPFTTMPHVFQNLGDGTYFHSGLLAIRAAVAAKLNITYKLLVNDAVAMTGGQPVEGGLAITEISKQLAAERVSRIAVVSDAPERWRAVAAEFAAGVTIHDRDELDAVQREFREVRGVSAIIYEQACAAEKRRRRKRGTLADPQRRVFINASVREGCGDCSVKSNCVSVEPRATEFGRKRRIDQSSCNKDYSCVSGFCPSFVLVEGARVRKPSGSILDGLLRTAVPDPLVLVDSPFNASSASVAQAW